MRNKQWLRAILLGVCGLLALPAWAAVTSTVTGQVVDVDGMPLAGVAVSATGVSATTDAGGMYSLAGVTPAERVLVNFSLDGYAPNQGVVALLREVPAAADDDECDEDKKHHKHKDKHDKKHKKAKHCRKHERHHGRKDKDATTTTQEVIAEASLIKTLLQQGAVHTINSTNGGSVVEAGFKVTFPADSLNVTGDVDVSITPMDVSTNQISGAPGDFSALTAVGDMVTLESFSMADFTLTQNGQKVNLKAGATAEIELLLPENTPLVAGDVKPLWYYDMATAMWMEEGTGLVAESTVMTGRLAVFATVQHFTYWNSDQPANQTAVSGRVVDITGNPIAGVMVEGFGVDYAGHSYAVPTDASGNYCIQIKTSATTELTASLVMGNILASTATMQVTANATSSTCASGATQTVPDFVLSSGLSCASGTVMDSANQPVAGVSVFTTAGSYSITAADGTYQVPVPAESVISVFTSGYPAVEATTPAVGDPCVEVNLVPGSSTGGTTCLSGVVYQCDPTNWRDGVTVNVHDFNDNLIGSAVSGLNGEYCIDGLPANNIILLGQGAATYGSVLVNTGSGGGTCASNTCNAAPPLDVWCY